MYVSKKSGFSFNVIEILNGRWTMDKYGLRKDPATVLLFKVKPDTTSLLEGGHENLYCYLPIAERCRTGQTSCCMH